MAKLSDEVKLRNGLDWGAFAVRSTAGLEHDLAHVEVEFADDFEAPEGERSVLLAGVHTGSLPMALAWIVRTYFAGWRLVIIKTREGEETERLAARRLRELGIPVVFLTLDAKGEYLEALRASRARTVIVCMIDLPAPYGKRRSGDIFWREAQMAGGAQELARICRARILLFASRSRLTGETVHLSGLLEPLRLASSPPGIEQHLDRWTSSAVIREPAQWHFWDRIDEYGLASA